MVTKSILKMALAAEKGTNFKKIKERRKHKDAARKKIALTAPASSTRSRDAAVADAGLADPDEEDQDDWDDEVTEEGHAKVDVAALDDSDTSESSVDLEEKIIRPLRGKQPVKSTLSAISNGKDRTDKQDEQGGQEEDIPLSDLEDLAESDKEDLIPHTRLTINNTTALLASLKRIAIPTDNSVPFATHQTVLSADPTADAIPDIADDLQRETALLAQSLDAARRARALLRAEGVPFSRPGDYFAEMVKDDGHMEKIKAKLVEEATARKASSEAKKLREMKKFGKQVQVAKLQERQKTKKETLEKIKVLKRKRQESSGDIGTNEADLFDVAVDDEIRDYKRQKSGGAGGSGKSSGDARKAPNYKRQKKDEKFGFGGKKRHAKSGDATSSGDLSGFSMKKMKAGLTNKFKAKVGKAPRLGKSRRRAQGSK